VTKAINLLNIDNLIRECHKLHTEPVLMKYWFAKYGDIVRTRLAAEKHLADGEFLQVTVSREEFQKLLGRT
jgi:hypothetical protein